MGPFSRAGFPTCHFELSCSSHHSGSILQLTGVISPIALLYLRYPNMCGVNKKGASPFHSLALLTCDTDRSDYVTAVCRWLPECFSGTVLYLVPGHLWLFVRSQVVLYVRAVDHFAVCYLSFLQMADFAAVALPLIALLHLHWHGHFHAVRWVPVETQAPHG